MKIVFDFGIEGVGRPIIKEYEVPKRIADRIKDGEIFIIEGTHPRLGENLIVKTLFKSEKLKKR